MSLQTESIIWTFKKHQIQPYFELQSEIATWGKFSLRKYVKINAESYAKYNNIR